MKNNVRMLLFFILLPAALKETFNFVWCAAQGKLMLLCQFIHPGRDVFFAWSFYFKLIIGGPQVMTSVKKDFSRPERLGGPVGREGAYIFNKPGANQRLKASGNVTGRQFPACDCFLCLLDSNVLIPFGEPLLGGLL